MRTWELAWLQAWRSVLRIISARMPFAVFRALMIRWDEFYHITVLLAIQGRYHRRIGFTVIRKVPVVASLSSLTVTLTV